MRYILSFLVLLVLVPVLVLIFREHDMMEISLPQKNHHSKKHFAPPSKNSFHSKKKLTLNDKKEVETGKEISLSQGDDLQEDPIVAIEESLYDDSPSIVISAVNSLGRLMNPAAIPSLINVYEQNRQRLDGYDESIRIAVISALGSIESSEGAYFLGQELYSDESIIYKRHIVKALTKIKSHSSVAPLEDYLVFLEANPPHDDHPEMIFSWDDAVNKVRSALEIISE